MATSNGRRRDGRSAKGTLVGYARCSTAGQDLTAQRKTLRELGVTEKLIYLDHGLTGRHRDRPGLAQALAAVRDGDTLVVPKLDRLARSVPDSGGVIVVPAFAGLGAPHWRPDARAAITGITRGTTRAHLARATLEGIALQNVDILRAMERDSGRALGTLKVDGGAAANDLLMQFQSDVLGVEIARPELVESTALGAAFLAGIGTGVWKDQEQIKKTWREQRRFKPSANPADVKAHLARWDAAVAKA